MQEQAGVAEREMFTTFNMGIGLIIVVAADEADAACAHLEAQGEAVYQLGSIEVAEGEAHVVLR
jgi:phosphoribosylformylglycinamidine cyclo-ligase